MTDHPATPTQPVVSWKNAVLAGLASYMDASTIIATGIALVLFQQPFGLSPVSVGILSALLTLSLALGAFVGGRLGDLWGRKRVYSTDLLVYATGLAVLITAVNEPMLYVGVLIAGLAMGADIPTSLALLAETAPEGKKGRMVSLGSALWILGIVVTLGLATGVAQFGELGARILYGHLLIVAIVTWFLRRKMKESAEWKAADAAGRDNNDVTRNNRSLKMLLSPTLLGPLVATALFYTFWNVAANTLGQFQTFLYVNIAGVDAGTASFYTLLGLPIGLATAILFMRIADSKARKAWFIFGAAAQVCGFAVPLVLGISAVSLLFMGIAVGLGGAFAGESVYKVWSQELFPTMLRSTAQGATYGFTRAVSAGFAVATPVLAVSNPQLLIGILATCTVLSACLGLLIQSMGAKRGVEPWTRAEAVSANPRLSADA